eukprot:403899_1
MVTMDTNNTLELYWSTSDSSNSSKELSLSPTRYEDYSSSKSNNNNNNRSLIDVSFSTGPLIEIQPFTSNELYEDEINSLELIHQQYIDKEKQYLNYSHKFIKSFNITSKHFKIYNNNIMRISWQLCQSRRIFQQSLQYFQRYLSLINPNKFSLNNIDLLGCVCLRLSAKHNTCPYKNHKSKIDDFKPKYYLKLLKNKYKTQKFNELELDVIKILGFDINYPTIYDFIVYELEILLLKIPKEHRKCYMCVYLKPNILLKIFEIIDCILLDIECIKYKPSLICECILKICFNFENWQEGLLNINNKNKYAIGYMPRLMTPTPTPTP